MTDTNKLKELAERATPGPWSAAWEEGDDTAWPNLFPVIQAGNGEVVIGNEGFYTDLEQDKANATFCAAANPQAILNLIAEVERLRIGLKGDYDLDAWLEWTREKDRLKAENEELRKFSAEAYQVLGALDAPENVLDNASDAANGVPLRHETLLPFFAEDYEALRKDAARYRWLIASAWYVGPEPKGDTEAVSWHDHNETMHGVTTAIDAAIEGAKQ
ncbi:ead/Ea22-like family protein [Pseudomonas aeruginosa]|uniref:ead/Ea22-like family protein n=1 Tax=Pseudomonas aeruginosa TaxID=287 RepID=UPI0032B3A7B7